MTYPIKTVITHGEATIPNFDRTGPDFNAAACDLERLHGPAPIYRCVKCNELCVNEPNVWCGTCLFEDHGLWGTMP